MKVSLLGGLLGLSLLTAVSAPGWADGQAPVVTEANLLESDRFWPYHVTLRTVDWKAADAPLEPRSGRRGVLVRVEDGGLARIDFGRHGLFEVPVAATDLVAEANRVRLGELRKMGPNLTLAVGPRLSDTDAEQPEPIGQTEIMDFRGFLLVFGDPGAGELEGLARALPREPRDGVLTALVPQGGRSDAEVFRALREVEWPVPFVVAHLAQPYTRVLLDEGPLRATVMLASNEGRILWLGDWQGSLEPLEAALDRGFGRQRPASAQSSASSEG